MSLQDLLVLDRLSTLPTVCRTDLLPLGIALGYLRQRAIRLQLLVQKSHYTSNCGVFHIAVGYFTIPYFYVAFLFIYTELGR